MATVAPSDTRSQFAFRRQARPYRDHTSETSTTKFMFARETSLTRSSSAPHIALIGNYPPQRCGLATFTADTRKALYAHKRAPRVDSYIVHDNDGTQYPSEITHFMRRDKRSDYRAAARKIACSGADLVLLQHEFGIFGGAEGEYILDLIDAVDVPVATTLHTILDNPSQRQDAIMHRLIASSDLLIVMAEYGRDILRRRYGVADARIAVIPHGIPDFAYTRPDDAKAQFGFEGRKVILTFGLLSHDKGIDQMVEAMPEIVEADNSAIYVVLGATHPNLVAKEGEALRKRLQRRASELGVADHICWIDAFVELDELVQYLKAADVYVTPYLNPMQITSGTLSYAVGMGKPVVSTPYIHASELLVRGNGVLVPFKSSIMLAKEIGCLLSDDERRETMAQTAYRRGRQMTWNKYAQALLTGFDSLIGHKRSVPEHRLETASAA